jgi:hypothetical protein
MGKSDEGAAELAARYRAWETADLLQAASHEAADFTPQALGLIHDELERRGQPVEKLTQTDAPAPLPPDARASLIGVKGWLLAFVVLFALAVAAMLLENLLLLTTIAPLPIKLTAALQLLIAAYGVVAFALLVTKHPRAPLHAMAVLAGLFLVRIGCWAYLSHLGAESEFPTAAIGFSCIWSAYLSVSRRVRMTYTPQSVPLEGSPVAALGAAPRG